MFRFGNFLLFDDAPRPGDGERWERLFEREFADEPRVRHCTLRWDRPDGETGAMTEEFTARGYTRSRRSASWPNLASSYPTLEPIRT